MIAYRIGQLANRYAVTRSIFSRAYQWHSAYGNVRADSIRQQLADGWLDGRDDS